MAGGIGEALRYSVVRAPVESRYRPGKRAITTPLHLCIRRTDSHTFRFTSSVLDATSRRHSHRKLQCSANPLLLSSLLIGIGAGLPEPALALHYPPPFRYGYRWTRVQADLFVDSLRDPAASAASYHRLRQGSDGIH